MGGGTSPVCTHDEKKESMGGGRVGGGRVGGGREGGRKIERKE